MRSQFAWFAPPMLIQPSRVPKRLVGRGQQMRRTGRARRLRRSRNTIAACQYGLLERRFHQRRIDDLALARRQLVRVRGENAHGSENARH